MPASPSEPSRTLGGYRARYCDDVVEFMAKGYSLTAFAGEIGVSRAVLTQWCKTHTLFAEAVERAQARRARTLEDRMLAAKGASAFGAHMQALKTAAPEEWGESRPAARSASAPGGRVEVQVELPDNSRE